MVIGKEAKNISEKEASDHILGYCIVNDVSEREWQIEKLGQWVKGKSGDTFGPTGPYLVTQDEIPDINNLNLVLEVNGKKMQSGNTKNMIFNTNFLISYLSQVYVFATRRFNYHRNPSRSWNGNETTSIFKIR